MKSNAIISVLSSFLLFTVWVSAFQWPEFFGPNLKAGLLPRQNNAQSTSATATASSQSQTQSQNNDNTSSQTGTQTSNSNQPQETGTSASSSGTQSGTNTITSGTVRTTGTRASNSTRTSAIDPRLPPGGISLLTPAPTAGMTFIKVGDYVTFAWNYTSLSVTPSYIDVVATNTVNRQTYTIAANTSWEATQTVVWDTGDYSRTASLPFVIATYNLMVYDSSTDPTDVPAAGHLGVFNQLAFGVYTPQPYTPLNEFKCASCSGAMSQAERQALTVLLGTCAMTILSFTWFASGFGLF